MFRLINKFPFILSMLSIIGCGTETSPAELPPENPMYTSRVRMMPMHDSESVDTKSATFAAPQVPAGTHLVYQGGKIIQNARIVQVLYGSGTYLPQLTSTSGGNMAGAYTQMVTSGVFDWLNEYNTTSPAQSIGRGSFASSVQITPATSRNGSTIDDSAIQSEIAAQISAGTLPAPTDNHLYMVHFPSGKTITADGASSCQAFCAYHGAFKIGSQNVYYGVMPALTDGCATVCGGGTPFQNQMSAASHELIEAVTDPEVFDPSQLIGPPLGWVNPPPTNFHEIGDICNQSEVPFTGMDGFNYTIQQEFSNQQNACFAVQPHWGTSPAIAMGLSGPAIAIHGANTNLLWLVGPSGAGNPVNLVLAPGTSPAIAMGPNGPTIAIHGANTDLLWIVEPTNALHQVDPPMVLAPGTNPAIAVGRNGPTIALHGANTDLLWTVGPDGVGHPTNFVLAPGTSPAIAMGPSGPVIAIHGANTDLLWLVGPSGAGNPVNLVLAPGTSPAIAMGPNGPTIAIHGANTDLLWIVEPTNAIHQVDPPMVLASGTNPAIAVGPNGPVIALHGANTDLLWTVGVNDVVHQVDPPMVLAPGSSPTIVLGPNGPVIALHGANTDFLWTVGANDVVHQSNPPLVLSSNP